MDELEKACGYGEADHSSDKFSYYGWWFNDKPHGICKNH